MVQSAQSKPQRPCMPYTSTWIILNPALVDNFLRRGNIRTTLDCITAFLTPFLLFSFHPFFPTERDFLEL